MIVGSIYRPPSSLIDYWHKILLEIEYILSFGLDVIFLGDFNYHFSKDLNSCHKHIGELCDMCSFQQLIHLPTRVTLNTKTIIDLIFTSCPEKHAMSGVIPVTLSDHFMVYSVLNEMRPTIKLGKHISVTKRNYNTLCRGVSRIFERGGSNISWFPKKKVIRF